MKNNPNKKKMDELTKMKLIYSGELLIFAIVFVVLGILILTKVIYLTERRQLIFTWITLCGSFILLGDFTWLCFSKKRQKKNSWIDKILVLPSAICLIVFDLIALISGAKPYEYYMYLMGSVFCYISIIYTFEGIYHYFKPVPALLEDDPKEKKKDEDEEDSQVDETPKDEGK
jgi:hypothetical protein